MDGMKAWMDYNEIMYTGATTQPSFYYGQNRNKSVSQPYEIFKEWYILNGLLFLYTNPTKSKLVKHCQILINNCNYLYTPIVLKLKQILEL